MREINNRYDENAVDLMKMYESVVDLMEGVIVAAPICFKLLRSTLICVIDGGVVVFTWLSSQSF